MEELTIGYIRSKVLIIPRVYISVNLKSMVIMIRFGIIDILCIKIAKQSETNVLGR